MSQCPNETEGFLVDFPSLFNDHRDMNGYFFHILTFSKIMYTVLHINSQKSSFIIRDYDL